MKKGDVVAEKYLLEEPLGEGGMGVVWLAYHRFLERRVAIKFLYPHLLSGAAKDEVREKFFQEARIGDRLRHPNIVEVRDIDSYRGVFFIVMEYIEGLDLRKLIKGKPLPEERIGAYTLAVLEALGAAHAIGFVHRDVKPSNIIISKDERAYLTDFGVAKALDTVTMGKSRPILTPEYAAPEQIEPERFGRVSPATDLYSLGITTYHMATGEAPFTGTTMEVLWKHVNKVPVAPEEVNRLVSPRLSAVIMKAVEKMPASRFRSAREMAQALKSGPALSAPVALRPEIEEQKGATDRGKETVKQKGGEPPKPAWLFYVLSFVVPLVGFILGAVYLGKHCDESKEFGKKCLIAAVGSIVICIFCNVLYFLILGAADLFSSGTPLSGVK